MGRGTHSVASRTLASFLPTPERNYLLPPGARGAARGRAPCVPRNSSIPLSRPQIRRGSTRRCLSRHRRDALDRATGEPPRGHALDPLSSSLDSAFASNTYAQEVPPPHPRPATVTPRHDPPPRSSPRLPPIRHGARDPTPRSVKLSSLFQPRDPTPPSVDGSVALTHTGSLPLPGLRQSRSHGAPAGCSSLQGGWIVGAVPKSLVFSLMLAHITGGSPEHPLAALSFPNM